MLPHQRCQRLSSPFDAQNNVSSFESKRETNGEGFAEGHSSALNSGDGYGNSAVDAAGSCRSPLGRSSSACWQQEETGAETRVLRGPGNLPATHGVVLGVILKTATRDASMQTTDGTLAAAHWNTSCMLHPGPASDDGDSHSAACLHQTAQLAADRAASMTSVHAQAAPAHSQ